MVMIFSNALSVDMKCWFTITHGHKMRKHGLATSRVPMIQIIQDGPICWQNDGYGFWDHKVERLWISWKTAQ
jgi:hypothetical protein